MAYAAITSLLQTLDLTLTSSHSHLLSEENIQLASLCEELKYLQAFLEDFAKNRGDHMQVKDLERRVENVVYLAEDVIETYLYTIQMMAKGRKKRRKGYKIFQRDLRLVLEEIKNLKVLVGKFSDKVNGSNSLRSGRFYIGSSSTSWHESSFETTHIVGLEDDVVKMKGQLTGSPSKLQILTIVGMAGIGKSTLAKVIYDDPLIVYHFYVRAWITVSPDYDVKNVLLNLIHSIVQLTDDVCEKNDESRKRPDILKDGVNQLGDKQLAEMLYRSLKCKRYLIVMDDIWDDSPWDDIRRAFPDDKNGSRIILTSRSTDLALHANSSIASHHMRFLSTDKGWELLKLKVFSKECCPSGLEEVGKQIVDECQGLPLAIIVVAGYLSKMSKKSDIWSNVADNVGSLVTRNHERFQNIIAMSYHHLPHHLKACFLYMGAFPEKLDIPVWRLMALWIAEGFLKQNVLKGPEEVAEECLKDLIDRSLIMVQKRTNDRITTCRMHDLLRDFCLREAEKENFWHVMRRYDLYPDGVRNHRRLCTHSDIFSYLVSQCSNPQVRTFLASNRFSFLSDDLFSRIGFELLRVLDIISYYFTHFPVLVLKLVHLRYLGLSTSGDLPASASHNQSRDKGKWCIPLSIKTDFHLSISNLINLQTLIVNWGRREIHTLPPEIQMMVQLRHIRLKGAVVQFDDLFQSSKNNGKNSSVLPNLQTLLTVSSANFRKEIVDIIPNIKKLGILVVDKNDEHPTSLLNFLSSLQCLETLKLSFSSSLSGKSSIYQWNIFPPNIKTLTLTSSHLPWEEMATIGKIPSLEVLKLKENAFVGDVWETCDGGFLQLKYLLLENNQLEHWKAWGDDFPSLERLVLRFCNSLEEIPYGIGDISTLQIIELCSCGRSAVSSARKILEEQQSLGNDELQVRINLV